MLSDNWTFFQAFLRSPRVVAAVMPSSSFLEQRIVKAADPATAHVLVELGGGTGGLTRSLLKAMGPQAHLLVIERTGEFIDNLEGIDDPRLDVVHGCASSIGAELQRRGFEKADAVVSGIPFSTMSRTLGKEIVTAVHESLAAGGRFVAYQYSDRVADFARPIMGKPEVRHELRNVPPVRVFTWHKVDRPRVNSHNNSEKFRGQLT
jgi:phospholipid N-methyltransferase